MTSEEILKIESFKKMQNEIEINGNSVVNRW